MIHTCMITTHLDNAAEQGGVLVNGLLPLSELWQSGHGGHEPPGVALQHVSRICVWVHISACLTIHVLDCLRSTDTNSLRQDVLRPDHDHVVYRVGAHAVET